MEIAAFVNPVKVVIPLKIAKMIVLYPVKALCLVVSLVRNYHETSVLQN